MYILYKEPSVAIFSSLTVSLTFNFLYLSSDSRFSFSLASTGNVTYCSAASLFRLECRGNTQIHVFAYKHCKTKCIISFKLHSGQTRVAYSVRYWSLDKNAYKTLRQLNRFMQFTPKHMRTWRGFSLQNISWSNTNTTAAEIVLQYQNMSALFYNHHPKSALPPRLSL